MKTNRSFNNIIQNTFIVLLVCSNLILGLHLTLVQMAELPEVMLKIAINTSVLVFSFILIMQDKQRGSVDRAMWIIIGVSASLLILSYFSLKLEENAVLMTVTAVTTISFCTISILTISDQMIQMVTLKEADLPMIDTTFYERLKKIFSNVQSIDYEDSEVIKFEKGLKKLVKQFHQDEKRGGVLEIYRIKDSGIVRLNSIVNQLRDHLELAGEFYTPCVQSSNLNRAIEKYNVRGCFFGSKSKLVANSNGVFWCKHSGILVVYSVPVDYQDQPKIEN
jgi:hypothetical protein